MQIVKAEAITCEIITDNNLSLSTANPLSRSFKVMFPDSKIAAGMFTSFSFLNTCSNIPGQEKLEQDIILKKHLMGSKVPITRV